MVGKAPPVQSWFIASFSSAEALAEAMGKIDQGYVDKLRVEESNGQSLVLTFPDPWKGFASKLCKTLGATAVTERPAC